MPSEDSSHVTNSSFCHPVDCLNGVWKPRDPPYSTIEEYLGEYDYGLDFVWDKCGDKKEVHLTGKEQAAYHEYQTQRLLNVMNWVWEPRSGLLRAWNAEDFVVRMLRSPGGIFFLGDSIIGQSYHWLDYTLVGAGIPFDHNPTYLLHHDNKWVQQHVLQKNHPVTRRLLKRAGVPESRLLRPIYTRINSYLLLGEQDVRPILENVGAQKGFDWFPVFDYVPGWDTFIKNCTRRRQGEEDTVTEDSILVINTGPHWSRFSLYMLPDTGTEKKQKERVTDAYLQMTNLIGSYLAPLPQLSIYYRATSPGHPTCTNITKPYPDSATARSFEVDVTERLIQHLNNTEKKWARRRWDWDLFESHNRIFERTIRRLAAKRKRRKEGANWFYFDIWDQALQRPDSHAQNIIDLDDYSDCLHWCVPGLIEQWMKHLNHWIFYESEKKQAI